MLHKRRKGQSTLEYAIIIFVVIAALLAMNAYLKRGVQGKMRESTDEIGAQFSPTGTNYTWNYSSESNSLETSNASQGIQNSKLLKEQYQAKSGSEDLTVNLSAEKLLQ